MNTGHKRVLLIGWDGADWRVILPLLEKGEMPHLERLVNNGVMGNLASLQPTLSPMVWTSIATGMLPDKHGILGFTELDASTGRSRPSTSLSRKVKALWNMLSQRGLDTHVVNWFCGHPAEPVNGVCVSALYPHLNRRPPDQPISLPVGTIHPEELKETLAELLVRPEEIDSQTIALFVRRFQEVDQHNDRRLEIIAQLLAKCFSVHAAATWILENRPWNFLGVYYQTIDNFCHGFMRFHPPRQSQVNEREFELYGDAVNSAYRLQDLLLGRLLQLAGDDATVIICSDHGFHTGELRPTRLARIPAGPAEEHRPVGMVAMKGPDIKRDELLHGANVLDIAPTVLTALSQPVGLDMDGRPLLEAWEEPPNVQTVPSWEQLEGDAGMHAHGARMASGDAQALLDQFVALGYVEKPAGEEQDAQYAVLENRWNLARVHIYSGRFDKALPLLEYLCDKNPLRLDFSLTLAECQFRLGLTEEAYEILHNLGAVFPRHPRAQLLLGIAEYYRGDLETSLKHLQQAASIQVRLPTLFIQTGEVYLALRRTREAMASFRQALEIDPDTAAAHLGMARCHFRVRAYEATAEAALQAVALEFSMAPAHLLLGRSLLRLDNKARAIEAFETALRFRPWWPVAHSLLVDLYEKLPDGREKAARHRRLIRDSITWRRRMGQRRRYIRVDARTRAGERKRRREQESRELMDAILSEPLPVAGSESPEQADDGSARPASSGKEFLIVSGLPRSGTSLMMQLLAKGGVSVMTDAKRLADEDNPEGYYEWEAIKRLPREPDVIEAAEGKAVKVVSLLLRCLPPQHGYRVIFMTRPAEEVAASQLRMLERQGGPEATVDTAKLITMFERHQKAVISRLEKLPQVEVLVISYPELVAQPLKFARNITAFLGSRYACEPELMASAVRPELYRQRQVATVVPA